MLLQCNCIFQNFLQCYRSATSNNPIDDLNNVDVQLQLGKHKSLLFLVVLLFGSFCENRNFSQKVAGTFFCSYFEVVLSYEGLVIIN